jgi:hypothetical protein
LVVGGIVVVYGLICLLVGKIYFGSKFEVALLSRKEHGIKFYLACLLYIVCGIVIIYFGPN